MNMHNTLYCCEPQQILSKIHDYKTTQMQHFLLDIFRQSDCCALCHARSRIGLEAIEVSWDSRTRGVSWFPSCCVCCGALPKTRVSLSSPKSWKWPHTRLMPVIGKYLTMRHPTRGEYELKVSETQSSSASCDCHTHIHSIVPRTCVLVHKYLCLCLIVHFSMERGG